MQLGKRLRTLRVAGGLQQKELAGRLNVSPNYVSMVENGRREPSLSFLRAFARLFEVPLTLLLAEDAEENLAGEAARHLNEVGRLLLQIERLRISGQGLRSDNDQTDGATTAA